MDKKSSKLVQQDNHIVPTNSYPRQLETLQDLFVPASTCQQQRNRSIYSKKTSLFGILCQPPCRTTVQGPTILPTNAHITKPHPIVTIYISTPSHQVNKIQKCSPKNEQALIDAPSKASGVYPLLHSNEWSILTDEQQFYWWWAANLTKTQ